MYSNYITPPDFVDDKLHTITVIDASIDDVELLAKYTQQSDEDYNIYLYRNEMNDLPWLAAAMNKSDSVIVNIDNSNWLDLCRTSKVFYYGNIDILSPSIKITNIMEYFVRRKNLNK